VNSVYDTQEQLLTAARGLCKRIAANSPLVVQGSKKVLQYAEDHTVDEGLEQVALWNSAFLQSPDLIEAGTAFMMRRTPEFKSKL
jgi:enoyl-CoA hydratase/carnithine racemase